MSTSYYHYYKWLVLLLLLHTTSNIAANDIANHPAWKKLDAAECGESVADRIIGGKNANLGQFPWIVRLGYKEYDNIDWKCGGALITNSHVVTAAHCVQSTDEVPVVSSIRLGEYDIRTDPDCLRNVCAPKVQDRKIKKITSHHCFNKPAFHNDLAVIELEKPVTLNNYVSPICLPRKAEQLADQLVGDQVVVAGWGTMNMTTEDRADVLQVVSMPVVEPAKCDVFGKGYKVAKSDICAGGQSNKDACAGDSGGPLIKVFDTTEGPKSFLVGIVSFGPTICGIKKPGVYSSVAYYLKWILDTIL
ncbi:hypothetical protein K1T71_010818 [Dendrolimus kikuchii]|uniref:Uncharacterized protein n=1 Tax=Dendrolimus kikuchii TaxID=765133 RepID=A0ACC1CPX9_9NEOP|nr:hypothetical protein K1T71_010818 [Dendrolimus kikuchii]